MVSEVVLGVLKGVGEWYAEWTTQSFVVGVGWLVLRALTLGRVPDLSLREAVDDRDGTCLLIGGIAWCAAIALVVLHFG